MHLFDHGVTASLGQVVYRDNDRTHYSMEFFTRIGIDPCRIRIRSLGASMNVPTDFSVNLETRQQGGKRNGVGGAKRGADQEVAVMMASG